MMDLKTDGTYSYSDPAGMTEVGICSISSLTETGYTVLRISYGSGTRGEWDTFVVNRRPATEKACPDAEKKQAEKPDVAWNDFAPGPDCT